MRLSIEKKTDVSEEKWDIKKNCEILQTKFSKYESRYFLRKKSTNQLSNFFFCEKK